MLIEYVGLQLPKYIKHAFYKMQIHHHHRHALLHRNASNKHVTMRDGDCFTNYFVFPAATHLCGLGGLEKNPKAASQA